MTLVASLDLARRNPPVFLRAMFGWYDQKIAPCQVCCGPPAGPLSPERMNLVERSATQR
jgi:hypothetical protein